MGVVQGAAREQVGAGALREEAVVDLALGELRVVAHRQPDLAVLVELVEPRRGLGIRLALAPQVGLYLVQEVVELGRLLAEDIPVEGLLVRLDLPRDAVEDLLDERVAGKVRRSRVGEAAGVVFRPGAQLVHRARRVFDLVGVVDHDELRLAPRRLAALYGVAEVAVDGGTVPVDVLRVGELLRPGTVPEARVGASREVLAVDPDEVYRALVLSGLPLVQEFVDRIRGVVERRAGQLYAVPPLQLRDGVVVDVGVGRVVAAVHGEVHLGPPGLFFELRERPVLAGRGARVAGPAAGDERQGERQGRERNQCDERDIPDLQREHVSPDLTGRGRSYCDDLTRPGLRRGGSAGSGVRPRGEASERLLHAPEHPLAVQVDHHVHLATR